MSSPDPDHDRCDGTWHADPAHFRPSRRALLQVGLAGLGGLALPELLRSEAAYADEPAKAKAKKPRATSVIHIFLPGGMSAQETLDPKPYAPIEYRGDFKSIDTKLSGVKFGELLPRMARVADKMTIVRSMSHGEAAHERGTHNMFTGYRPSPALQYPSIGSVISHELGSRKQLPPYVCIPNQPNTYAGPGYLSAAYSPFSLGDDPARNGFRVRDLAPPQGLAGDRRQRRRKLLDVVNEHFRAVEESDELDAMDAFYQDAYKLISSPQARQAFDLSKEPGKLRDAYGRNQAGQRMLLSRRLVEAGVRFVSMTFGGWDMHDNISAGMRSNLPPFDQAYAMLLTDLEQRGMLDSTLVLLTTEFGRTPKINRTQGRDHYPKVFSIAMAGGGVKRGFVYGASDENSIDVAEDRLTVADWAATVYELIGIDHHKRLMAPGDRPIDIVRGGVARRELMA